MSKNSFKNFVKKEKSIFNKEISIKKIPISNIEKAIKKITLDTEYFVTNKFSKLDKAIQQYKDKIVKCHSPETAFHNSGLHEAIMGV